MKTLYANKCHNSFAAAYFVGVATIAALIGQHVVRRLIILFGRASLIIFILAFTIFVSAISLGEQYNTACYHVWWNIYIYIYMFIALWILKVELQDIPIFQDEHASYISANRCWKNEKIKTIWTFNCFKTSSNSWKMGKHTHRHTRNFYKGSLLES